MLSHTRGGIHSVSRAPVIDALEPRLLLALVNGVDPYNLGKGDWVWQIASARSNTGSSTNLALFQYLKNKGMKWVTVKAGDGTSAWSQFTTQLVNDAHTAGLKIFGWSYQYGADPAGEANVAKAALAKGADGFIIDAEGEYERLANNAAAAQTFCESVRAAYPNHFLAHAPFPIVSYHSAFPYYTFGKYCDAVMPQDYWDAIGVTPARMNQWRNDEWNTLYNSFRNAGHPEAIKPIVPIAQGWNVSATNTLSDQELLDFASLLKTTTNPASPGGYKGLSFWSVQHHTAEHWSAIGQISIGEPKFAAGTTIRVQGTGTSGLKAWSNSSSVSPATYVVKPEGAVGTIVAGPVFAEGYNRWEVRWKGETGTRWSAEDWLVAAPAPTAPVYASPANGAAFVKTAPTTLSWQNVDVATSYDVYLDGVFRVNTANTTWVLPPLSSGTHSWQIRSRNSAGVVSGASWSFRFVADPLTGDANVDGKVDGGDFVILYGNFGKVGQGWQQGDFDGDGDVDFVDYQALSVNFGKSASAAAAVVEETAPVFSVKPIVSRSQPLKRPRLRTWD
jgi:hypothetical protein